MSLSHATLTNRTINIFDFTKYCYEKNIASKNTLHAVTQKTIPNNCLFKEPRWRVSLECLRRYSSTSFFNELDSLLTRTQKEPILRMPNAVKKPSHKKRFGVVIEDDYSYFCEDSFDKKLSAFYVGQEKAYADYMTYHYISHPGCVMIHDVANINSKNSKGDITDIVNGYEYFLKKTKKGYEKFYRKNIKTGSVEVVLDPTLFRPKKGRSVVFGPLKISKNNRFFAYLIDLSGKEYYDAHFTDLENRKHLGTIRKVNNVEWSPDGNFLYYICPDELYRPYRLYRHKIGSSHDQDVLLYEEKDPKFFLDILRSKSWKYLIINSNSKTASELRILNFDTPEAEPKVVHQRRAGTEVYIDHVDGYFYKIFNSNLHSNYSIYRFKEGQENDSDTWQLVVEADDKTKIFDIDILSKGIVLYQKCEGNTQITVLDPKSLQKRILDLPSPLSHALPGVNLNVDSECFRFTYSTPLDCEIKYDHYFDTNQTLEIFRENPFDQVYPFNRDEFVIRRVEVPNGNVSIPMTLVHKKNMQFTGDNLTMMHVYGAYGTDLSLEFDPYNIPLLQRDWVIAYAHVRGGGELGKKWHLDGKLLNKKNSFSDFVACAKYLIEKKYSSSQWMCARASSAGGLILGYIANEHPNLFKILIMLSPFLDIYNTMSNKSLPLTEHEYDEWGDPQDEAQFRNIIKYDPVLNVKKQFYPNILIRSSLHDVRVPIWNSLRYCANLRAKKINNSRLLLLISDQPGHVASNSSDEQEISDEYGFIYSVFNIFPKKIIDPERDYQEEFFSKAKPRSSVII